MAEDDAVLTGEVVDAEASALAPTVKAGPAKDVTFKGRVIPTVEPSEEQFLAMVRLSKLPRDAAGVSGHRMVATLNRVPDLVRALCASEVDEEWFEDGLVNGEVKIEDLPEFCANVMTAWWAPEDGGDNRATKRAAARKRAPAKARLAR